MATKQKLTCRDVCTILLAWRCLADAVFVMAANRDELVARPAAPPALLNASPPIFGGRDLLAGGTWLAVTPDGRLAAVTNRSGEDGDEVVRDPSRRSRGELPITLLGNSAGAVLGWLTALRPADYNPFNILSVTASAAVAGLGGGGEALDIRTLEPGLHVLCTHDVDDLSHPKEVRIGQRLAADVAGGATTAECIAAMTSLLSDHDPGGADTRGAVCIHDDTYGTVSASVVALGDDGGLIYRHAAGRPCVTPFVDVDMTVRAAREGA